jgi:hypothetical protein
VVLTGGGSTIAVVVPAGAQIDGHVGDIHAHVAATGGPNQPLNGTLVQDATMCASGGSGMVQIPIQAGSAVDGNAVPSAGGIQAAAIHFHSGG